MAAQYIPIKRISSLDTPIKAEKLDGSLFTTENQAHEFIVSVRKNGVKQTVTGSVSGKFIRANGTTIFLQGSIVDGDAVVRLHQDCYNVQGRFTFNIFNTQSGVTTCIYSAVGKIDMGSTETVIDAGDVVPDVSDVVAAQEAAQATINAANTAAQTANTAAQNVGSIVARPYSSGSTYTAGDYCTNNGNLYKANQDISTAEEWTASHWTQIVMGDEVTGLKSTIIGSNNAILDIMGISIFTRDSSAEIRGSFVRAFLFEGINLKAGVTYTAVFTLKSVQSATVYCTICDNELTDLKGIHIASGNTTGTLTYTPSQNYVGAKVFISGNADTIGAVAACHISSNEKDNLTELQNQVDQKDYYHDRVSFAVTKNTGINTRFNFSTPLPAGDYSIRFSGLELTNGKFYVSLHGATNNILTQTQEWIRDKDEIVTASEMVYGVSVYSSAAWILSSGTITIDVLKTNRIVEDEKMLYGTFLPNKTPIGKGFATSTRQGTSLIAYDSTDNTAGIQSLIRYIVANQSFGRVSIPNGIHAIKTPIAISSKCIMLDGEVWNYPDHPNGVVPSNNGTVLKLSASNIHGIDIQNNSYGFCVYNLGIVGSGWDTSGLLDREHPEYNVGIYQSGTYTDQIEFRKNNFTGLAAAFCANKPTETGVLIDVVKIHDCNMDGCDTGVMIDGASCIYSSIFDNLIADTPAYAIFLKGNNTGVTIKNNILVRNAGKFSEKQKNDFAEEGLYAVYVANAKRCVVSGNIFADSGQFANISSGSIVAEYDENVSGLYFSGTGSIVDGNTFEVIEKNSAVFDGSALTITANLFNDKRGGVILNASSSTFTGNKLFTYGDYSLTVNGDSNMVSGNIIPKKIKITGNSNIIVHYGSSVIEIESGATNNIIIGANQSNVIDNGTGTVIK